MKKFAFILILFLTLSSICYARTTTSARISQDRIVIGGIKLSDDMETVLKILGKPSKYTHEDTEQCIPVRQWIVGNIISSEKNMPSKLHLVSDVYIELLLPKLMKKLI